MTYPDNRTQFSPGQPSAYTPTPAYRIEQPPIDQPPPAGYAPAPAQPQHSKRRVFWTRGPGVMVVVFVAGLLLFGALGAIGGSSNSPAASPFTVSITSCEFSASDALPTATVGLSVKNSGNTTRSAAVRIEYRDGSGARLDTDTAYVRNIAAGDTARTEESTLLDATATSLRCVVAGVS